LWLPWQRSTQARDGDPQSASTRILPHLDAAYNLARWLMRDPVRAEDVVQDAVLKAMSGEAGFRGGDPRAWLLRIVRNTAYDALSATRRRGEDELDDTLADPSVDAETQVAQREDLAHAAAALEALPLEWREAMVLRELEGLSYREIADITGAPIGTVMSRLSRARAQLIHAREARS
jgi:RNA polymerase sigma-70 factor (ECF subfamily)